jgi:hypothetical protein
LFVPQQHDGFFFGYEKKMSSYILKSRLCHNCALNRNTVIF